MFGGDLEKIGKEYYITCDFAKEVGLGLKPVFKVRALSFARIEEITNQAIEFFRLPRGDKYDLGVENKDGSIDVCPSQQLLHQSKGFEKLHFVLIATGTGV